MRPILLNPGPVSLSESVRRAVARMDLCHREPEFFELQDEVIGGLLDIYQCDRALWTAVLVGGSGTSAMEAMMASLLPATANVLVLENGVYGERLSRIANIYDIPHQALKTAWVTKLIKTHWPIFWRAVNSHMLHSFTMKQQRVD